MPCSSLSSLCRPPSGPGTQRWVRRCAAEPPARAVPAPCPRAASTFRPASTAPLTLVCQVRGAQRGTGGQRACGRVGAMSGPGAALTLPLCPVQRSGGWEPRTARAPEAPVMLGGTHSAPRYGTISAADECSPPQVPRQPRAPLCEGLSSWDGAQRCSPPAQPQPARHLAPPAPNAAAALPRPCFKTTKNKKVSNHHRFLVPSIKRSTSLFPRGELRNKIKTPPTSTARSRPAAPHALCRSAVLERSTRTAPRPARPPLPARPGPTRALGSVPAAGTRDAAAG